MMMPFTSTQRIPRTIPRHFVQASGRPEHLQVRVGPGQGLQAQDPPQNARSRLLEAVQDSGGTSPIHGTNSG